jgi:hypothetical protein
MRVKILDIGTNVKKSFIVCPVTWIPVRFSGPVPLTCSNPQCVKEIISKRMPDI